MDLVCSPKVVKVCCHVHIVPKHMDAEMLFTNNIILEPPVWRIYWMGLTRMQVMADSTLANRETDGVIRKRIMKRV